MSNESSTYQLNIAEAFAVAFGKGQIPFGYQISEQENVDPNINYSGLGEITQDEVKSLSYLGTAIHFKFALKGGDYNAYDLKGNIEQRELQEFQMPLTTMVEFTRAKRIKTTPTVGGHGTVKEMYGFEDWSIKIRGVCINDPGHPQAEKASEQIKKIQAYEGIADAIELVEDDNVFTDLAIYSLVIKKMKIGSVVGKPNYLPFELDCISDEPLELIL